MNKEKNEYEFLIRGIGTNISVKVTEGELSYVTYGGEQEKCSHDIEKHPNWEYAEELLEIICDCDREKFIDISKVLNLSSEGRRIVKRIAKKKLIKSQSKVALAMEEVNVWANMLLS